MSCECPICDYKLDLAGYEENDIIHCPGCNTHLEIVSLYPPVLEEALEDEESWEE